MHRSTPSVQFAFRCLLVSEGAIICRGGSQGAIYHSQSVGRKQNCVTTKVYNYLSQSWAPTGFIHELDWIGLDWVKKSLFILILSSDGDPKLDWSRKVRLNLGFNCQTVDVDLGFLANNYIRSD